MAAIGRKVNGPLREPIAIFSNSDVQASRFIEPVRQPGNKPLANMLDDENGDRKIAGKSRKKRVQCRRATGAGGDGNHVRSSLALRGSRPRSNGSFAAAPVAHDFDLR